MTTYTFEKGSEIITVEAASYKEALVALTFKVGGEIEAAEYIYRG